MIWKYESLDFSFDGNLIFSLMAVESNIACMKGEKANILLEISMQRKGKFRDVET